ncbi:MAG: hypothetical protein NVSMB54_36350 [Ktedonobacteraceae bacterium]
MNDTNMNEAAKNLSKSVYETNQTIARSAVEAQERNMRFAQSIFDNGIEVLKNHAEATQNLMRTLATQSQNPQGAVQAVMESTAAAQERNVKFAQNVAVNGTEVFKSHIDATRTLMQDVVEKTREQQELLLTLPYVDAYMDMFRAPLANYKQAVETAQALTKHAMEVAQQSAQKGMEVAQNVAHQTMDATLSATRHNQQ